MPMPVPLGGVPGVSDPLAPGAGGLVTGGGVQRPRAPAVVRLRGQNPFNIIAIGHMRPQQCAYTQWVTLRG